MSKTVIQNRFDGGIAEDLFTNATNECEICTNFDIFTNPHKLLHHRDQISELGSDINSLQITDVGLTTISGTTKLVAFGHNTSSTSLPASYTRDYYDMNGSWNSQQAVGVGGYAYCKGTYIQYGDYSFVLSVSGVGAGATFNLQKYTTAGSLTSVGTFTAPSSSAVPRPYIHPDDKILYMCVGNTIAKYDLATGTFSSSSSILPTGYMATSITHFGGYLQIALVPLLTGDSLMVSWGRDMTLNTLQASVNLGSLYLRAIENLEGSIICVSSTNNSLSHGIDRRVEVKGYYGGDSYKVLKSIGISTLSSLSVVKARKDDKLYFAVNGEATLYCVAKNKTGRWVVTQDRLISPTGGTVSNVYAINFVGDYMYIAYSEGGTYKLSVTDNESSVPYLSTSTYRQSINCGMTEADKHLDKKLEYVEVTLEGISGALSSTLKYVVDGVVGTIQAKSNIANRNFTIKGIAESDGKPFKQGKDIQIQVETTTGTNIKEIRYKYVPVNLI